MTNPNSPRVGGILSADIAVPEHDRELRFYSRVLRTGESPLWRENLTNNRGTPIIGLGARTPDYEDLPLQWMPHIQVADVAASAAKAIELGGTELMHGKDTQGVSQWAVLLDPSGAAFGIVPVIPPEATPQEGEPPSNDGTPVGCIAWFDLTVPEAQATRDFYQQVIGWSVQDVEMADGSDAYADYNMLGDDEKPAAGVCHARGANTGLPAVWMMYLPVGDLGESVRLVSEEGGEVIKATQDAGGAYTQVVIQDPVGVCLTLVQG